MKNILVFLFVCAGLWGEVYPYRDILEPPFALAPEVRIVVASPPRTGSTLVYNILQYLFEDRSCLFSDQGKRVKKVHNIQPFLKEKGGLEHLYLFCTLRNPLTQFSSLLRVGKIPEGDSRAHFQHYLKESFYFLRYFRRFPHFSFLIYETFERDFSPIFCAIEKEFSIQIGKEERDRIQRYFSREALNSLADSMGTFAEVDPITGIHGEHISLFPAILSSKKQKEFERLSKPLLRVLDRLKTIPDDL